MKRSVANCFFSHRGMVDPEENAADSDLNVCIKDSKTENKIDSESEKKTNTGTADKLIPKLDSCQVGVFLNYLEPKNKRISYVGVLKRPYLRTSIQLTVAHIKKFLKKRLIHEYSLDVNVSCNGEIMDRHHTMEFICVIRWSYREGVLTLDYTPKVEL